MVDVKNIHVLCVQHPENLLDVGGHLLKSLFAVAQGRFRLLPAGDVTNHGHVPPGPVVSLCCVFDKDRLAIPSQNSCPPVFAAPGEEALPVVLESSPTPLELLDSLSNDNL